MPPACPQGERLVGTREDGGAAPCVVREVQLPAPPARDENGAAGSDGEATEDEGEGAGEAPPPDPEAILYVVEWLGEGGVPTGERPSLRRAQLVRAPDTPLAALTKPLLQRWVETVATAEPVAVRAAGWLAGWTAVAAGCMRGVPRSGCWCVAGLAAHALACELQAHAAAAPTHPPAGSPNTPQGVAGVSCLWRVAEYWRAAYGLPTELPPEMAERLRPARRGALAKVPSLQAAAGEEGEEGEGGAGGGGAAGGGEDEYDPESDAQLAEELAEEAAEDSELSDDGALPGRAAAGLARLVPGCAAAGLAALPELGKAAACAAEGC